jgi:hypothetical protein
MLETTALQIWEYLHRFYWLNILIQKSQCFEHHVGRSQIFQIGMFKLICGLEVNKKMLLVAVRLDSILCTHPTESIVWPLRAPPTSVSRVEKTWSRDPYKLWRTIFSNNLVRTKSLNLQGRKYSKQWCSDDLRGWISSMKTSRISCLTCAGRRGRRMEKTAAPAHWTILWRCITM